MRLPCQRQVIVHSFRAGFVRHDLEAPAEVCARPHISPLVRGLFAGHGDATRKRRQLVAVNIDRSRPRKIEAA